MHNYEVWTDGSTVKNPGAGGWAALVCPKDRAHNYPLTGSSAGEVTTSNRMELMAVIQALCFIRFNCPVEESTIIIVFTDSQYVANGFGKYLKGWREAGWKTRSGSDVKNADLWRMLHSAARPFLKVDVKWVRGHAGTPENELVDALAKSAARSTP